MRMLKITRGGQVSIPAEVRRRWQAQRVVVEDEGDRLVLRPIPDDPISAMRGALKGLGRGLSSDELRRIAREEEAAIERGKWERSSTRAR